MAEADTVYPPVVVFAVNDDEAATPSGPVVSVSVVELFDANVPLAPIDGAANVTITPLAGAPFDVTVTTNGAAHACTKAVPMAHFCCAPLVAVIEITGVGFELELQLVMNPEARQMKARRLA
ncbi:MAG: hypothetical protein WBP51_02640 [Candidatus Sulfotelmatobacter sp.]